MAGVVTGSLFCRLLAAHCCMTWFKGLAFAPDAAAPDARY